MRRGINWLGLILVGAAAAILTFTTLRSLAEACGFTGWSAWLLPVAVDAAGAVATNIWLTGRDSPAVVRFACSWALTAAFISLLGNATQHGLAAYRLAPPWWVVVVVAMIAPLAFVGTVHLMVLLAKAEDADTEDVPVPAASEVPEQDSDEPREEQDELLGKAQQLLLSSEGLFGRTRLAREMGISEHRARLLLEQLSNSNGHVR